MTEIEIVTQMFPVLDRLIQWIIIPVAVVIYSHNKRHNEHEKKFIRMEGENARILSILEERQKQRDADKKSEDATFKSLAEAVTKLNERLDALFETHR